MVRLAQESLSSGAQTVIMTMLDQLDALSGGLLSEDELLASWQRLMGEAPNLAVALSLPADMLEGCYQRALAAYHGADYVGALAELQCLCLFCPDKPKVWMALGSTLQQLAEPVLARQCFERVLEDRPDDAGAWFRLAECLALQNEMAAACLALRQCLALCRAGGAAAGLYQHAAELLDRLS